MSRSTWYYNMNALKQGDRYAGLKENIRKIYHYHKGRYGYRRITLALRKQGLRKTWCGTRNFARNLSAGSFMLRFGKTVRRGPRSRTGSLKRGLQRVCMPRSRQSPVDALSYSGIACLTKLITYSKFLSFDTLIS